MELQIVRVEPRSASGSLQVMLHASGCARSRGSRPLVATAIVASIGNGAAFHKGREFAAWMGLVPKPALDRGQGGSFMGSASYAVTATCARS